MKTSSSITHGKASLPVGHMWRSTGESLTESSCNDNFSSSLACLAWAVGFPLLLPTWRSCCGAVDEGNFSQRWHRGGCSGISFHIGRV